MAGGKRKALAGKLTGIQYGALPWRYRGDDIQILLVTSRRTRRWIIPKGWPMEGLKPTLAAAREALEEAGVEGQTVERPVGVYRYMKVLRNGAEMPCRVEVFALQVTKESHDWDEMDARERRWCSVNDAAAAVVEPQLKAIIRRFGTRMAVETRRKRSEAEHGRNPA
jgi:8-oxo-dGTP pyrophosphatase MutT (NUDIX family)